MQELLKQEKRLNVITKLYMGKEIISLKKSSHNKLQIEILEKLVPLISGKPELLYIGDAADRTCGKRMKG